MNYGIIKRTIGWILLFETAFFLVPVLTALIYGEKEVYDFLIATLSCALVGGVLLIGKPKKNTVYAREGFVIVALCWVVLSLFGALPLYLSEKYLSILYALYMKSQILTIQSFFDADSYIRSAFWHAYG